MTTEWKRVVEAADCEECPGCGELVCPVCEYHYAQCGCPGPHQHDEYRYAVDGFGNTIARPWLPYEKAPR